MSHKTTGKLSGQITSPYIRDKSGFWNGFGNIFNVYGGRDDDYDTTTPWWVRDREAIRQDWEKIGDDFRAALVMPIKDLND